MQVYVSMGSRAKDVIPLDLQNKILEETRAHFTSGNYYQVMNTNYTFDYNKFFNKI